MSPWTGLSAPMQFDAVVALYESHWLSRYAEKSGSLDEVLAVMAGFFAVTGGIVRERGGRLIKTLGDVGLAVFPAELADAGVLALRHVQDEGEAWLSRRGYAGRVTVKADFGPVILGRVGSPGEEIIDMFGRPVATAFQLPATGFAMTAPLFRQLAPETRKLFKKHTPAVRYIAIDDHRPHGDG